LSSDKCGDFDFDFDVIYKPDSMISNGSLKGLNLLTRLIKAK
jgi:hypothetical protein